MTYMVFLRFFFSFLFIYFLFLSDFFCENSKSCIHMERFVIGWIGRFDYAKGLDLLMDSIAQVSARMPHVVWVVIGDGDCEDVGVSRARAADRGQAGKVVFLGARNDACGLIQAFDLYVSTSRWEGLPLVLLK